ncbi:MAG: hypothetical protein GY849_14590 [Deltaproteobacteria bacterium]|nr:hypothetical protein [Deltaproteobacteria bacterium]
MKAKCLTWIIVIGSMVFTAFHFFSMDAQGAADNPLPLSRVRYWAYQDAKAEGFIPYVTRTPLSRLPTTPPDFGPAVYYVSPAGHDANPGTETLPWRTIQKAADTLTAGETVYIKNGTYNERVIAQNSGTAGNYITYSAYQGHAPIIDGTGFSIPLNEGLFHVEEKNYIKITGLKIQQSRGTNDSIGICLQTSHHIIVEKNHVYDTQGSGIEAWESHDIIIDQNEVEKACDDGEQECITMDRTHDFEIRNNHVHHGGPGTRGGEGICATNDSYNGRIYGNTVHHVNRVGIYVDAWSGHTRDIEVFDNVVHDSAEDGYALAAEMGGLLENITVYNNLAYNNGFVGMSIADWGGAGHTHSMKNLKVINNTFYNNGDASWGGGISVENADAQDVVIRNNIVSQNSLFQIHVEFPVQNLIVDHNLIHGYRGYDNEIRGSDYVEGDPLFHDPLTGDFHLHRNSPAMDSGSSVHAPGHDFDGDSRPQGAGYDIGADEFSFAGDELAVSFSGGGLWHYDHGGPTWVGIGGPVQGLENFLGDLAADFGAAGLWLYDGAWAGIGGNPDAMEACGPALYVDFGATGLWRYDGAWAGIGSNPDDMQCCGGALYVDFDATGLWRYNGAWTALAGNPTGMWCANGVLYANLSGSLWKYDGVWSGFGGSAQDVEGCGSNIYVDFGATGLWRYNGAWAAIGGDPSDMQCCSGTLYVDYGGSGLWQYNGAWSGLAGEPEEMCCADALYVDFAGGGLWRYDGTWTGLAGDTTVMTDVDINP